MSRKTNIPRKIILGDRGIQTYRTCDKGFADSLRLQTFKETNDVIVVRESEYAKPYGEQYEEPWEDYSAMEYQVPNTPPWGWDYPGMEGPKSPWHIVFYCGIGPCWCEDQTLSFDAKCSWEIVNAEFNPPWSNVELTFNKTTVFINAAVGTTGCGTLTITMRAPVPKGGGLWQGKYSYVIGKHRDIQVCMCSPSECDVCDNSGVVWDYGSSASQINRSQSDVSVYISDPSGKGGPYTWSVSGTGFTLDNAITEGLVNILNADATACGMAEITVTGCDGSIITGFVWCTTGGWGGNQDYCLGCAAHSGLGCIDYPLDTPTGRRRRNVTFGCGADLMIRTDCPEYCYNWYPTIGDVCGDCGFPPLCRSGGQCTGNVWIFESYWQQWQC